MINLETLYEISLRHTKSMGTLITDEMERMNREYCHFGGTHVLFTGDFYQLKPVFGQPIYFDRVENISCEKGRDIWLSLNEYVELIENTRYRNDATPHMNLFLRGATIGKVDMNLLHIVNERLMASVKMQLNVSLVLMLYGLHIIIKMSIVLIRTILTTKRPMG